MTTVINSATTVAAQLAAGTTTAVTGVNMLGTLNSGIGLVGSAPSAGGTVSTTTVTNSLNSIASVVSALSKQTLTPSTVANIQTEVTTTISNVINTIPANPSVADAVAVINGVSAILNASLSIPGATVTSSSATNAATLMQSVLQKTLSGIGQSVGQTVNFTDVTTTQQLLTQQPTLLKAVLDNVLIKLRSVRGTTGAGLLASTDLISISSEAAATLTQFINTDDVVIQTSTGALSASNSVRNNLAAFNSLPSSIKFNSTSTKLDINFAHLTVPVYAVEVGLAPASIPTGLSSLSDGTAISVDNGLVVSVVPAAANPATFAAGLEASGATVVFDTDGSIDWTASTGQKLSGTFGYEYVVIGSPSTAPATITMPTGSPTDPKALIKVSYADSTPQNIAPFMSVKAFYDSVAAFGYSIVTDRNTGVLHISGTRLRPSYYVTTPTSADLSFHATNKDKFGIAYRGSDLNGDGRMDYEVITATSKQIVYGLP